MDALSLSDFSASVFAATRRRELWDLIMRFARARGVAMVSYHHYAASDRADSAVALMQEGFPTDWVQHYISEALFEIDPIPTAALARSEPFFWSEAASLVPADAEARRYLRQLEMADFGDGLAFQVFGPQNRNGYVGMGFGGPRPELPRVVVSELKYAAQIAHLRYCDIVPDQDPAPARSLSARETEILRWIAQGKSNGVIADILGVSRHTVDSLVRRIFTKLEASDRTSAAIKGLGRGILQINTMSGVPRLRDMRG